MIEVYKPNNGVLPRVAFGHGVYQSNRSVLLFLLLLWFVGWYETEFTAAQMRGVCSTAELSVSFSPTWPVGFFALFSVLRKGLAKLHRLTLNSQLSCLGNPQVAEMISLG